MDGVIGNSSSALVEAPSFQIGSINIGSRQKGRIMAESVISCGYSKDEIQAAFSKLYSSEFQERLKTVKNPYGEGCSSKEIIHVLKHIDLQGILMKEFYDTGGIN